MESIYYVPIIRKNKRVKYLVGEPNKGRYQNRIYKANRINSEDELFKMDKKKYHKIYLIEHLENRGLNDEYC